MEYNSGLSGGIRKRITLKKGNDHTIRIETIGIETGIYLIQVQLENGKLMTKKIIIDN